MLRTLVLVFLVVAVFGCLCLYALDVQDYKEEFPNGDPNIIYTVGSREGTILHQAPQ